MKRWYLRGESLRGSLHTEVGRDLSPTSKPLELACDSPCKFVERKVSLVLGKGEAETGGKGQQAVSSSSSSPPLLLLISCSHRCCGRCCWRRWWCCGCCAAAAAVVAVRGGGVSVAFLVADAVQPLNSSSSPSPWTQDRRYNNKKKTLVGENKPKPGKKTQVRMSPF